MSKPETIAVPVELVRELKAARVTLGRVTLANDALFAAQMVCAAVDGLPEPPKPDPVEECKRAYMLALDEVGPRQAMATALRCYRKILGLTPDPELGE